MRDLYPFLNNREKLSPVTLRCSAEGRASKGDGTDLGLTRDQQIMSLQVGYADLLGRASFEAPRYARAPQDDGRGILMRRRFQFILEVI